MIQKSRLKNTFSTFIFGVFLFFAPFAIAEDSVPKAYAEFDLTHPFDGLAQSRAVDSYIESLGFDPDGYEALPIATERIEELFRRARLIKSVRNAPPGTSEKREILYTQQIPNELITLGLSKILLRAPTDEVLDFFVRHSISLEKGGSGPMPLVLWVGDPDCCYLDIYRNQVVGLLANSKAITISMLLASLCRTETIEKKSDQVALAHVLFHRYRNDGKLRDSEIQTLLDKNLGVNVTPSAALTSVIEKMRCIASGQYFYIPLDKAAKMGAEKGLLLQPTVKADIHM